MSGAPRGCPSWAPAPVVGQQGNKCWRLATRALKIFWEGVGVWRNNKDESGKPWKPLSLAVTLWGKWSCTGAPPFPVGTGSWPPAAGTHQPICRSLSVQCEKIGSAQKKGCFTVLGFGLSDILTGCYTWCKEKKMYWTINSLNYALRLTALKSVDYLHVQPKTPQKEHITTLSISQWSLSHSLQHQPSCSLAAVHAQTSPHLKYHWRHAPRPGGASP